MAATAGTIAPADGDPMHGLEEVTDPSDAVVKLVAQAKSDKRGLLQLADELWTTLVDKGLGYTMAINPRSVGVDVCNRHGQGLNPLEVFVLANEIAELGWSWAQTRHATCVEVLPGDLTTERFNATVVEGTGLPPPEPHSIKYGSLSGGHTNYVLRCIAAGVASDDPLLSDGGRMSLTKLQGRDPTFGTAVCQGLTWRVLVWQVRILYPAVLDIIQTAMNMPNSTGRKENEMQGLLKLHSLSATAMRAGSDVNWPVVKRAVLRSRPQYSDNIDSMVEFLVARSGGADGHFLRFLSAFHRHFVNPSQKATLPGMVYTALAGMREFFMSLAIFEAAYACPRKDAPGGVIGWVRPGDITALANPNNPKAVARLRAAEEHLKFARVSLDAIGLGTDIVDQPALLKPFVSFDISMAAFVLDKQQHLKATHKSARSVARAFVQDLRKVAPHAKLSVLDDAWPDEETSEVTAASSEPGPLALYAVAADGTMVDPIGRLRAKGFDLGLYARKDIGEATGREEIRQLYKLTTLGGRAAVVMRDDATDNCSLVVGLDDLLAEWVVTNPKAVVENHPQWPECRPALSTAGRGLHQRGAILASLQALAVIADHDVTTKVEILWKPTKKVVALVDLPVGALVLLPETRVVKSIAAGSTEEVPSTAVSVSFVGASGGFCHYLMPASSDDVVAPLWVVTTVDEEDKANMKWTYCHVQSVFGVDFAGPLKPSPQPTLRDGKGRGGKGRGGKGRGRKPTQDEVDEVATATSSQLEVPVLINAMAVKQGDVLTVFKKKAQKVDKALEAITVARVAKRARMS